MVTVSMLGVSLGVFLSVDCVALKVFEFKKKKKKKRQLDDEKKLEKKHPQNKGLVFWNTIARIAS